MLDYDGRPVGALLSIYTARSEGGRTSIHCNLSSWYVEPAFRNYSMMMAKITQRHKHVTYAGAIGRFLLPRGRVSVALDGNGRVEDLVGVYREPLGRKYFKGPQRPWLAYLTDTELVLYGP
jgi:hypothetical protein